MDLAREEIAVCRKYTPTEEGLALNAGIETLAIALHREHYPTYYWHSRTHECREHFRRMALGLVPLGSFPIEMVTIGSPAGGGSSTR